MNAHTTMLHAGVTSPATSAIELESEKAPVHIGSVSLASRNVKALAAFYQDLIGLDVIRQETDRTSLGSGGVAYLHLLSSPQARAPRRMSAGLFHTAFLLPSRAALGAWFVAASERGAPIEAASDHDVSEAFYLTDPEGNGIEVYADRDRSLWRRMANGHLMTTARMDVRGVAEAGKGFIPLGGDAKGRFPSASRIGHVHLSVGDIATAENFYHARLGFDVTDRRPGGTFFSTGGYHHHLATNTWQSQGAGPREDGMTGLADLELTVRDPAIMTKLAGTSDVSPSPDGGLEIRDPWGTKLTFSSLRS